MVEALVIGWNILWGLRPQDPPVPVGLRPLQNQKIMFCRWKQTKRQRNATPGRNVGKKLFLCDTKAPGRATLHPDAMLVFICVSMCLHIVSIFIQNV